MLMTFMTISGWLFWGVVSVVALLNFIAVSTEDELTIGWAITVTTAAVIATFAFTDAFIGVKIAYIVIGLAVYVLFGIIWSFKKWYTLLVNSKADAMLQYDNRSDKNLTFKEWIEKRSSVKQPTASEHKTLIIGWMALWPFSLSWWILTWPRHAFIWAYNRLSTVFQNMSDRIWNS